METQNDTLISQFLADLKPELVIAMLSKCKPNWAKPMFTPTYSKIYYIESGEGRLTVGGQELFPQPGQMVFAPAGLPQSFSATHPERTYQKYWCHFNSNISFMNLFTLCKLPYGLTMDDPSGVIAAFERLVTASKSQHGPAKSIRIQAALLDLISCYMEQAVLETPKASSTLTSSKLSAVLQYIDINLIKDMSIAELAEQVHHHPNYFIRFFKNHLGVTPMTYIYERRMEKAKQLIMSSDMPIGEVARATGFHDIFHFSKTFKKRLGVAPTEFRSLYSELHFPKEQHLN
ncbi:Arabinose operon regulatory protein [Paenibacillus solanacearum]|uniref:Arabinose operon regulatory protein n=1 Tax=Paenibacillus solanacearum TaxID=2048548 RepID=A0A916KA59_9BACL|nr:AraC family transcriptional regulator [Paenibacillus solanacearum]CAG7651485.1 Arabinose operon regulatory protein [Paenibacillus solanacearum]